MPRKDRKTLPQFAGPIPEELKLRLEASLREARIQIGVLVLRCAEFAANMTIEELRTFCYGTGELTLRQYVADRVREEISLQWPPVAPIDETSLADAARLAEDATQALADAEALARGQSGVRPAKRKAAGGSGTG
jgi:hypothetical protein